LLSPELAELASVPAIGRSVRWLRRSDVASTLEKDEIQTDRQTDRKPLLYAFQLSAVVAGQRNHRQ